MDYRFRFCPKCGKPIKPSDKKSVDCPNCGFRFYFSPASTNALILVNDRGKILLTKRKLAPRKGYWDLPGGFVDFKETVEQSLKREIREELGFELKEMKYQGSYWSYYPYKGIKYQTLCHAYTSRYRGEKIKVDDDVTDYKFFPKEKIPHDKLSFEDIKSALKDFVR